MDKSGIILWVLFAGFASMCLGFIGVATGVVSLEMFIWIGLVLIVSVIAWALFGPKY